MEHRGEAGQDQHYRCWEGKRSGGCPYLLLLYENQKQKHIAHPLLSLEYGCVFQREKFTYLLVELLMFLFNLTNGGECSGRCSTVDAELLICFNNTGAPRLATGA